MPLDGLLGGEGDVAESDLEDTGGFGDGLAVGMRLWKVASSAGPVTEGRPMWMLPTWRSALSAQLVLGGQGQHAEHESAFLGARSKFSVNETI